VPNLVQIRSNLAVLKKHGNRQTQTDRHIRFYTRTINEVCTYAQSVITFVSISLSLILVRYNDISVCQVHVNHSLNVRWRQVYRDVKCCGKCFASQGS